MKRALSLILVLILCLGLCACGEDENKTNANIHPDYVGEWKCMRVTSSEGDRQEYSITLNEDGTGSYDGIRGTWKYSEENSWAVLTIDPGNVVMKLKEADGTTVLTCYGDTYYRAEEFMEYGTETITITADNWQKYFELHMAPYMDRNDFDEITGFHVGLYLQLKSEYGHKLLNGSITGEYLLSVPTVHSAWIDIYDSGNYTYNISPYSGDCTYNIDAEETMQQTFEVGWQTGKPSPKAVCNQFWGGYADSITKADNTITMLVTLFSKIDLLRVEGSITVFK